MACVCKNRHKPKRVEKVLETYGADRRCCILGADQAQDGDKHNCDHLLEHHGVHLFDVKNWWLKLNGYRQCRAKRRGI